VTDAASFSKAPSFTRTNRIDRREPQGILWQTFADISTESKRKCEVLWSMRA